MGWREDAEARGRNQVEEQMARWEKQYKEDREVRCPHCDHLHDNDGDGSMYPVTYWAEDGPEERDCEDCGKQFFVEEHVTRTWKTAKTKEELDD